MKSEKISYQAILIFFNIKNCKLASAIAKFDYAFKKAKKPVLLAFCPMPRYTSLIQAAGVPKIAKLPI